MPIGWPDRDAAAVHVQLVAVDLQFAFARDDLRRERLVDLDQVDVGERQAGLLQDDLGGRAPGRCP
jgi:hypothetical protein